MTENNDLRFIKEVENDANYNQMERFVSFGEVFEALGFPVDQNSDVYNRGWYKGKIMTWNRYLFERYKEEHPDDPNIKHHGYLDLNEPITLDWKPLSVDFEL